jgi:hypothetical protein
MVYGYGDRMEEQKQPQQVKVELDHSKEAFYSNDFAVLVPSTHQIVIDFRQTLPRMDVVAKGQSMTSVTVKHTPIVMQPETVKMLSLMLRENVKKLEKEIGEIELPKEWKLSKPKQQKIVKKPANQKKVSNEEMPKHIS